MVNSQHSNYTTPKTIMECGKRTYELGSVRELLEYQTKCEMKSGIKYLTITGLGIAIEAGM